MIKYKQLLLLNPNCSMPNNARMEAVTGTKLVVAWDPSALHKHVSRKNWESLTVPHLQALQISGGYSKAKVY